ncbi:unnamed protein product [Miscanthus lutarioriparius]|uniref:HMA domain-containing protein n=1 Tax=Miscanthus lutarioriparius TaxID=422564 RepID=A0A811NK98_9POAL|nr:unnamed protein product [Miscanthus lutarioriparius]
MEMRRQRHRRPLPAGTNPRGELGLLLPDERLNQPPGRLCVVHPQLPSNAVLVVRPAAAQPLVFSNMPRCWGWTRTTVFTCTVHPRTPLGSGGSSYPVVGGGSSVGPRNVYCRASTSSELGELDGFAEEVYAATSSRKSTARLITMTLASAAWEAFRRFRFQVEMHCRCIGCVRKVEKAMASIGSFSGIETSVGDVNSGIITVVGKVNPTEICHWLKRKTKKNVKAVYPDTPIEDHKQKMILVLGSSSQGGHPTPSAPPLQDDMPWALVPSGVQPDHESLHFIEEKIRDELKIKKPQNELMAAKIELKQSMRVINGSKKVLLDSALNQLKAYKNLEALSQ